MRIIYKETQSTIFSLFTNIASVFKYHFHGYTIPITNEFKIYSFEQVIHLYGCVFAFLILMHKIIEANVCSV